jgi:peptidoglycan/LPS O-acetylase OafA/YrhL
MTYRPEIDGLRGVAVLAVIIYHLKLPLAGGLLLPGGFLGVDVFFVLSGYLITGLLLTEFAASGRIVLRQFYARRARRILPPLLLVMLCSLPAAWILLLPGELERLALSLVSGLAFVSNFFWFHELSTYGAQSGLLQPFLHLWSLAIEEQFYLFFPPLLLVLLRRGGPALAMRAVLVGMALSLAAAQWVSAVHPGLSFYLPSSRAWELLAGAALAFLAPRAVDAGPCRVLMPLCLAVLILCLARVDLTAVRHPGLATLAVILASCGLICCATPGEPVTRTLSSAPMVWLGRLSYSLYLWHFPIFAFGRLRVVGEPGAADMAVWLVLTFALAVAGHHLVERPFRFTLPARSFVQATCVAVLVIGLASGLVVTRMVGDGGRQDDLASLYGAATIDNEALRRASWAPLDDLMPDEDIAAWNALEPSAHELQDLWFTPDARRRVLIIGDSHAKDMFNALTRNQALFAGTGFARFALNRHSLEADLQVMVATPNFRAADTILIAPRYHPEYRDLLATVLAVLAGQGKEILVLGNTAEFDVGGDLPLFDWYLRRVGGLAGLNAAAPRYEAPGAVAREAGIRAIAVAAGAGFLSRRDLMCDGERCTLATPAGLKTMYDDTHWTLDGAALFGRRAAEAGWLQD